MKIITSHARLYLLPLFAAVLVVLPALLPFATVADETYTVNTQNDTVDVNPGDGVCEDASGDCSLRAAVQEANEGGADTIIVPAGLYEFTLTTSGEDAAAQGDLDFTDTDTTTITGDGAETTIIDPNDSDRVFDIHAGASVIISNIATDDSAVSSENGGAMRTNGTTQVSGSVFENAVVTSDGVTAYYGGAVYCGGGTLSIDDTSILNNDVVHNSTQSSGGGIAVTADCEAEITNSSVIGNGAYHGGGIYYMTSAATQNTLTDVTIAQNTATDAGAGIVTYGSDTDEPVTLNRVTLHNNEALSGGGIFSQAPINITNSTFYQNTATDAGGAFGSNPGADTPLIQIAFSTFTNNTASISGGIYADGGADVRLRATVMAANTLDCYGSFTSLDYNYIQNIGDCSVVQQDNDEFNISPPSYFTTASLQDNGGEIDTLPTWGSETLDLVPAEDCLDAAGAELSTDARGLTRPENTNCDRGAYEKDQTNPVVTVTSGTDTIECGVDTWTDAGATVVDNHATGLTASASGSVTEETVDLYTITYTSDSDYDGNTGTNTRDVTVEDTTSPVLSLTGEEEVEVNQAATYTDAGATATDACYGVLTGSVEVDNPVNTNEPGEYTVTYTLTDASGNEATPITRTVTVLDTFTEAPTLTAPATDGNGNADGLTINYTLPEMPSLGTVQLVFTNEDEESIVLTMGNDMSVNFTLDPADLSASLYISSASADSLPDGVYTVTLSYRDVIFNPTASVTAENVTIDTVVSYSDIESVSSITNDSTPVLNVSALEVLTLSIVEGSCAVDDADIAVGENVVQIGATGFAAFEDGEYTCGLRLTDVVGNTYDFAQTFTIDTTAPVITLLGAATIALEVGDTYTDEGATAADTRDGDITEDIAVDGEVDVDTAGTYELTYTVSDTAGNAAEAVVRTVTVTQPEEESEPQIDSIVRLKDGRIKIIYDDDTVVIHTVFENSKKKPRKVYISKDGVHLFVLNPTGKKFVVINAETGLPEKTIRLKKKKPRFIRIEVRNFNKSTPKEEMISLSYRKGVLRLTSLYFTQNAHLHKRNTQTIELPGLKKFKTIHLKKHKKYSREFTIKHKKKVIGHYRIGKKGKLLDCTEAAVECKARVQVME